ncbi:rho family-interacting cell polarization regulator 1 isoform X4 [Bubalus bubalis]|uniref:rho family-interacting cell polarization regulator 1 isoform X4 n=1 Tax=Bubalus bubalis TaxID=89462 RepID=UPI001E1B9915|nr:rho family-interacting cell polarization regulator 1 isoform X4 [Bubalus bubalis]
MSAKKRGSPARTHSMMSLSVRPQRRLLSARVSRSQSFAGVLGSQERGPRSFPAFSPPGPPRKPPVLSRVSKMFSVAHPAPKVPQPERLDLVYTALKRGLTAYLEVHQQEQEKLQGQIRESKRNSRLGFLYDLDKQVKSIERFLRRLEFHASKIDELYESYCVQRRLRDGAYNMVRAYSTGSPGSREARDSLAEATRGHREYTESMCLLESELEAQLGEFHLRMKGLAGFARLCVGDQYEIYMKYGRQRWKLRGRIESSGKQVWDSEETVFLPLLTEFLSIKVVAVDINDLGTIKLSLEVTWSPFDKDDQPSAASTVNKASTVTKRFSTYSQSPPDTPSLREQAFYNMLRRQEELENGTAWSLSSESSDDSSSPQLSGTARHSSAPRPLVQQPEPLPIQVAFRRAETSTSGPMDEEGAVAPALANGHAPYSRTLSHISEASVDAALAEASVEAADLESLVRGPSPPACPVPTLGEHPAHVPPALDAGHSATNPTLSTTGPAPSAHLGSANKTINSSSPELPTQTTTGSTYCAMSPTHSAPSLIHCTTASTHKTMVSILTTTGPTPSTTGPVQTTSPTHKPVLSTLTPAAPTPNATDPVQTTTSLSHTVTNLTHTVTSATNKPMVSTLMTAGPTASATGPVQTTTSPTHTTTSPTHTTTSPTHTVASPTHTTASPTYTTTGPTHTTASPTYITTGPTHTTASPTHTTTGPTHTTATTTPKAKMSTNTTTPNAKDPVQTTRSPTHSVTSPTLITVSPSTFLDFAKLSSPSADTDPPHLGTDPLSGSYLASAPCTQADPISPSTSHPSPACSSWEPLTTPSPDPPEAMRQSPSLPPSPLAPVPQNPDPKVARATPAPVPGAAGGAGDRRLEEALGALMAALDDYRGQFPELQGLEQEVTRLESLLMQRQGLTRSRASSLSITVEHALESFSFLNEDEDEDNDSPGDRPPNSLAPGAEDSLDSPSARPLSTECPALDAALVQHLYHCSRLLLKLGTFGPLRCQEAWALERLLREARVLEAVCELSRRWEIPATSAQEVVQFSASRPGFLTFWDQCTEGLSPFICPVERVLLTFCNQYSARLSLRQPGLAEAVCVKFLEDALGQKLPRSQAGPGEQLTVFQFWSYVEALDCSSMEAYVTETAEEVLLVRNLNSDDQAIVLKALRLAPEGRLQRDGLRALSSLLVHGNNKVMAAVSTQLRSLSLGPAFRERALLCFLDQLEDEDVQTRVAGCLALGCIKAPEGIEPLVYLCQTDTEAVREAARQSLQQCGEEGQSAHRRLEESLDALPRIFGPGSMASTAF